MNVTEALNQSMEMRVAGGRDVDVCVEGRIIDLHERLW